MKFAKFHIKVQSGLLIKWQETVVWIYFWPQTVILNNIKCDHMYF